MIPVTTNSGIQIEIPEAGDPRDTYCDLIAEGIAEQVEQVMSFAAEDRDDAAIVEEAVNRLIRTLRDGLHSAVNKDPLLRELLIAPEDMTF